jgi:hypothetical protein
MTTHMVMGKRRHKAGTACCLRRESPFQGAMTWNSGQGEREILCGQGAAHKLAIPWNSGLHEPHSEMLDPGVSSSEAPSMEFEDASHIKPNIYNDMISTKRHNIAMFE